MDGHCLGLGPPLEIIEMDGPLSITQNALPAQRLWETAIYAFPS